MVLSMNSKGEGKWLLKFLLHREKGYIVCRWSRPDSSQHVCTSTREAKPLYVLTKHKWFNPDYRYIQTLEKEREESKSRDGMPLLVGRRSETARPGVGIDALQQVANQAGDLPCSRLVWLRLMSSTTTSTGSESSPRCTRRRWEESNAFLRFIVLHNTNGLAAVALSMAAPVTDARGLATA